MPNYLPENSTENFDAWELRARPAPSTQPSELDHTDGSIRDALDFLDEWNRGG
jgi:hypothetical protein